jgi:phosphoribosylanthranilate isomerase
VRRPQVKICGITRVEDAAAAVAAGADAIGLVFFEGSRRAVTPQVAGRIVEVVGPLTTVVGLFVNASAETVRAVCDQVPLNVLQFHGDEPAAFCEQFSRPYIKALPVGRGFDVSAGVTSHPNARAVLLDTASAGQFGGSGETFDWELIPKKLSKPLIVAGGLDPDNVAIAVRQLNPAAVDVSSGVESEAGIKDAALMAAFVRAAKG